jgi:8-oxo-dGTP pyrophosphatase MutT (NUDIX family)
MHITIYFNEKPLILCDQITKEIEYYLHRDDAVFIDEYNIHTVNTMLYEMSLPSVRAGVFLHKDVQELLKAIKKKFLFMQAAGGLVYTPDHKFLLIFRRGKWDLPKGKLDEGESLEECAVREVKEETGVENIKLDKALCNTYHTYHQDGRHILKESHWYLMQTPGQSLLVPQTDEDIEKCEWAAADKLAPYMENTHPSIIDVLKAAIKNLHEAKNI